MTQFDIKKALFHLCKPKVRLLDKQVKKPTFYDPKEIVRVNKKFKSAQRRVVLAPQIVFGATVESIRLEEVEALSAGVIEERDYKV